jgi:transmembrane sensor
MRSSRQIESRAAAWLARRECGDWHAADQAELDAWLAAATAHRVAFLRLESAWVQSGRLKALGAGLPAGSVPERGRFARAPFGPRALRDDIDLAPDLPRRRSAAPRRGLQRFAAVAAVAVAVLGLTLGWHWQQQVRVEAVSYRTPVGALEEIPLADGSRAVLSSDSQIDVALSQRERHIDLRQGEAYFDVAKDAGRPFAVSAGGHNVVAVGTRFAVRYDQDQLRVVVTEGTVRLESPAREGRSQPVTLLPAGSVAVANAAGVLVKSGSVDDAESDLGWRRGYVVFRDTPLLTAVAEFNRYSTRPIVIADAAAAQLRVGGSFRWSNAEVFVSLIEQAMPVRAEHEANRIVLHSR